MKMFLFRLSLVALVIAPYAFADGESCDQEMAVVLCVAERNMIRMERYTMQDFAQETICLPKKERDMHCFLELNMTGGGFAINDICWIKEAPGLIAIRSARSMDSVSYCINMLRLFDENDTRLQHAVALCIDTTTESIQKSGTEDNQEKVENEWLMRTTMEMPCGDGMKTCTLMFNRKIKSVCCMVVPACAFETVRCSGKIKREEACEMGLLCSMHSTSAQESEIEHMTLTSEAICNERHGHEQSAENVVTDVQAVSGSVEQAATAVENAGQVATTALNQAVVISNDAQQITTTVVDAAEQQEGWISSLAHNVWHHVVTVTDKVTSSIGALITTLVGSKN